MVRGKHTLLGAYLVRGDHRTFEALIEWLRAEEALATDDPDLFAHTYRSFGVDEARMVHDRAYQKALGARRYFVLHAGALTANAQNALLKVIEEPPAGAVFFLVTPSPETLLPTLRSRMQTWDVEDGERAASLVEISAFLKAPPAKRLDLLKPLYEHGDDGRDMSAVITFLQALECALAHMKHSDARTEGLSAVYRARRFADDKGSLLKALLEQVALLLPKM